MFTYVTQEMLILNLFHDSFHNFCGIPRMDCEIFLALLPSLLLLFFHIFSEKGYRNVLGCHTSRCTRACLTTIIRSYVSMPSDIANSSVKTKRKRQVNIYIYIYYERKKGRNYISQNGKCSCVLFSSHNIYFALIQRIEHCSTRKSTCRLPIH